MFANTSRIMEKANVLIPITDPENMGTLSLFYGVLPLEGRKLDIKIHKIGLGVSKEGIRGFQRRYSNFGMIKSSFNGPQIIKTPSVKVRTSAGNKMRESNQASNHQTI